MNPIEMPGPGAPPEQVIAFLSHQLQAMSQHVNTQTETEAQISRRVTAMAHEQIEQIRQACDDKIKRVEADARRYGQLRAHTIRVGKLKVHGSGQLLDHQLDQLHRKGMT